MGFISLLLTFGQVYIGRICIPIKDADSMFPCPLRHAEVEDSVEYRRKLLCNDRRFLAAAGVVVKIMQDREMEELGEETSLHGYEFSNDPLRFRLTHETYFVKSHSGFRIRNPSLFYIVCFFQQFFWSAHKSDYMTMCHGFISVHLAPGSKFVFQKYIKRPLEDDFKVVVGINPFLWATIGVFLLLNVNGWKTIFWASLSPLIVIVAIGTKLQAIINQMALDIQERHVVVHGIPLVQVNDKYFWFSRPALAFSLIHFILFQNAFQITYFFWIWYEFGLKSCFHHEVDTIGNIWEYNP
ncbi:hypothetical protein GIB67_001331 [Kingdonia uniflora]|uniref:MLO-like protein n=1 Tax=Kingdonia uniflora TaxID=39325 RepID=A0A7J7LL72_9MAGN|nr:hypothetical protein GIB67_001331 [Kingdonia uniflora]